MRQAAHWKHATYDGFLKHISVSPQVCYASNAQIPHQNRDMEKLRGHPHTPQTGHVSGGSANKQRCIQYVASIQRWPRRDKRKSYGIMDGKEHPPIARMSTCAWWWREPLNDARRILGGEDRITIILRSGFAVSSVVRRRS